MSQPPKASWGFSATEVGFSVRRFFQFCCAIPYYQTIWLNFYDVGGHEKIRNIWPNYYADVFGCVFVIDSNDRQRFPEVKRVLHEMANHTLMKGKPLLLIANQKIADTSVSVEELKIELDIQGLIPKGMVSIRDSLILIRETSLNDGISLGLHEGSILFLIPYKESNG